MGDELKEAITIDQTRSDDRVSKCGQILMIFGSKIERNFIVD